jgi:predicted dehydrogenase
MAIRTALLSFGMSGRVFHAPFIHLHSGFTLVSCWERTQKHIQSFYPSVKSVSDMDLILEDPSIELIIVNTPIYTHFEYAQKALQAGKHIVVEKAFTSFHSEALALEKLAKEVGKEIFVYQNRRLDSDFLTVKKVYDSGVLGEIVEAEFHFDRFNGAQSPKLHKEIPGPGAGIVKDLGPHIIDQALYLFGKPKAVFADFRMTRPKTQVEDLFEILLYYPTLRVRLKAGYYFKEPIPSYQLHGKKGSFLKVRADKQEPDLVAGLLPQGDDWGTESPEAFGLLHVDGQDPIRIPSEKGDYMQFYNNVHETIAASGQAAVSASDGALCMQVIDAAFTSSHEQRVISLS